ncbi:hypothetical protein CFN78_28220 [Amycolatopsis antarctica]|uniref:Nucleoside 2-deoxyribosyltransferase n=1 Tax=Amycolatopsis antarctica TaxID=1854586 RepID=A0A263CUW2_9PSEU|nr:nucleoside 2-deoxyribosyltransferase domain-containing protein [Amycolatopsis antarctica]OZM69912.1 hypothetical protein CFN78_28220 [Amycolatopsis antarctica]
MIYGPMYYEAPTPYIPLPGHPPRIFLAGGITGVQRWHDHAVDVIEDADLDVVILNPNREQFPIGDPAAGPEQVAWEQMMLHLPNTLTLMWFPESDPAVTVQPIAMYELGQAHGENRELVVGADPGYPRSADVTMLTRLSDARTGRRTTIHTALDPLLDEAITWLSARQEVHA